MMGMPLIVDLLDDGLHKAEISTAATNNENFYAVNG